MKKGLFTALAALALGALGSCDSRPSPGIEAGNPNVSVKSMRVLPKTGDETYEVLLLDETTADVSQVLNGDERMLLDEVVVPYRLENNTLILEARFANSRLIGLTAAFSPTGDAISGVLKVDGGFAEACFEVPGQTPSCLEELPSAPLPPPSSAPFRVADSDIQENNGGTLSDLPLTGSGAKTRSQPTEDPYAAYCVTIDGRPACMPPPDRGDVIVPSREKTPSISEIHDQIELSPLSTLKDILGSE